VNAARCASILLLLTLLPFSPAARAGEKTDQPYEQLVVVTKKGERIEGREGRLGEQELTARFSSGKPTSIPLADIKTLYVVDGNMALVAGAAGAVMGLVTGFLAGVLVFPLNGPEPWVIGAGLGTVGGAAIGGLLGSSMVTWRVQPVVTPTRQYTGLQLSLSL